MSTDISDSLAAGVAALWPRSQSVALLSALVEAVEGATSDWDEGAGEGWARVLVVDRVVAFVWMAGPLVLVDARAAALRAELVARGIQGVVVSDAASEELRAERRIVEQLARRPVSEAFDADQFSAEDLVWATI